MSILVFWYVLGRRIYIILNLCARRGNAEAQRHIVAPTKRELTLHTKKMQCLRKKDISKEEPQLLTGKVHRQLSTFKLLNEW